MLKALLILCTMLGVSSAYAYSDYLYGTDKEPRYIVGETEESRTFEMSDYSYVFMMGEHFYQAQHLVHLKDCPGCEKAKKMQEMYPHLRDSSNQKPVEEAP